MNQELAAGRVKAAKAAVVQLEDRIKFKVSLTPHTITDLLRLHKARQDLNEAIAEMRGCGQ